MASNTDEGSVAQQTFDWTKEEYGGEVSEGIKFDPEVEYTLELISVSGKVITSNGKQIPLVESEWVEETSDVKLRQSFFPGRQTINLDKPEKSSAAIVLANALGYKVAKGDKFHIKNILKVGMKIKAHIVPQVDKKGNEMQYSCIDLKSARKVGSKQQAQIPHNPSEVNKYQSEVTEGAYKSKEKFIQNLTNTGRYTEIAPFVAMCEDGKITF